MNKAFLLFQLGRLLCPDIFFRHGVLELKIFLRELPLPLRRLSFLTNSSLIFCDEFFHCSMSQMDEDLADLQWGRSSWWSLSYITYHNISMLLVNSDTLWERESTLFNLFWLVSDLYVINGQCLLINDWVIRITSQTQKDQFLLTSLPFNKRPFRSNHFALQCNLIRVGRKQRVWSCLQLWESTDNAFYIKSSLAISLKSQGR